MPSFQVLIFKKYIFFFLSFCFLRLFCLFEVFKSGLHTHKAGTLPVEPHLQSHFALVILKMGSQELFACANFEL
jgi:hypothetical protein